MALMPKRVKYRKQQRGRMHGNACRKNFVAFGEYGLQTLESHWITGRQIEAGRIAATHFLQREGKVYIRIFPDHSYSAKPLETRMGKGKAEVAGWVARVKPGTVLFEIGGVPEETAKVALLRVAHKMPVRCRLVTRRHSL
jgi:large subunit ribosomal protein L16